MSRKFPWWDDQFAREVIAGTHPTTYRLTSVRQKTGKANIATRLHAEVGAERRVKFAKMIALKGMGKTVFGAHPTKKKGKRKPTKVEERESKKRRQEESPYRGLYSPLKLSDVISIARRTRSTSMQHSVTDHPTIHDLLLFDTHPGDIVYVDLTALATKSIPFEVNKTQFNFEHAVRYNGWACSVTYTVSGGESCTYGRRKLMSCFPLPVGDRLKDASGRDGPILYYRNKQSAKSALLFAVLCRDTHRRLGFIGGLMESKKKRILKLNHQREFTATWAAIYVHQGEDGETGTYIVGTSGGERPNNERLKLF